MNVNVFEMAEDTLPAVSELIERRMGLHFPRERHDDLSRGLDRAAEELGAPDHRACIRRLLATDITREENDVLARALTVGETYFFREPATLKAMEETVLPELIERRRKSGELRLRLWSAGCCTGEEPYTLAIILARLLPDLPEWDLTILATDINSRFLAKARTGRYGEWSFRGTPAWVQSRFFSKRNADQWELDPLIRSMVAFSYLNLVNDVYPSLVNNTAAMDVILCRNVTMYFTEKRVRWLASRFYRALLDEGWLVVGPSEACHQNFAQFRRVSFDGSSLYRKTSLPQPPEERPAGLRAFAEPATESVIEVVEGLPTDISECVRPVPAITTTPCMHEPIPPQSALRIPKSAFPIDDPVQIAYDKADYHGVLARVTESAEAPPEYLALAARASANLGRLDESLDWCRKALARDKLQPSLHYLEATILVAKNDPSSARESLKRVLYLDPGFVLAHFTMANILAGAGEADNACRHLRNMIRLLALVDRNGTVPESEGMTAGALTDVARRFQEILSNHDGRAFKG